MTTESDLKYCPFCGDTPEFIPAIYDGDDDDCDDGYLRCPCGIETELMPKSLLVETWNARYDD